MSTPAHVVTGPEVSSEADVLDLIRRTYPVEPDPVLASFVDAFRAKHGDEVRAVLFYGSRWFDRDRAAGSIYDFFVVAGDYRRFYRQRRDAVLNRFLAPNTYELQAGGARCKYNVISLGDLMRETSPRARDLFHAGRLSKRVGLVFADSARTREAVERACLEAMKTVLPLAVSRLPVEFRVEELVREALAISYAAEIRVEADSKVERLLAADAPFYRAAYGALLREWAERTGAARRDASREAWIQDAATLSLRRARTERVLSRSRARMYVRWFKYMATLEGWLDLLLDKIERTQGIRLELTPLQRKYPYLFGWGHFWRFVRRGLAK